MNKKERKKQERAKKYKTLSFTTADSMLTIFNKLNEAKIDLSTTTMDFDYEYDYGYGCGCCAPSDRSVASIEIRGEVKEEV